jgi:hypothetical protein
LKSVQKACNDREIPLQSPRLPLAKRPSPHGRAVFVSIGLAFTIQGVVKPTKMFS